MSEPTKDTGFFFYKKYKNQGLLKSFERVVNKWTRIEYETRRQNMVSVPSYVKEMIRDLKALKDVYESEVRE